MSFETPLPPFNASDAHATFLNVSCLDLLLIEMVPLAERMARRAERLERGELEVGAGVVAEVEGDGGEMAEVGRLGGGKEKKRKGRRKEKGWEEEEGGLGSGGIVDEEAYKDAIFFRLDGLGYRVGQGLSERYVVNLFHDHSLQELSLRVKVILKEILKHPPPHHFAMGYRCGLLRLRFDSEDRNGF
jgi:trafficking protein particle complex subunit 6